MASYIPRRGATLLVLLAALLVSAAQPLAARVEVAHQPAGGDMVTFLPMVTRSTLPVRISPYGVEIDQGVVRNTISQAVDLNASMVRYGSILWSDVEATPGVRDWSRLAGADDEIATITANGSVPLVIVRGTPVWAQKVAGSSCGPIKPEALDAFAAFMHALVARYSAAPYNVRYWEIGNEPDVDPSVVPPDSGFGCWGDKNDQGYGGGYYAEMLKHVYPAIKAANPDAQVVMGGLLLDCDPTYDPSPYCAPGNFLEGVLRNGGAAGFDILAYHAYVYYSGQIEDWDRNNVDWAHRGGSTLGKADFLRSVMAHYGVDKPILLDEAALLCRDTRNHCPGDRFFADQANYAVRLFVRSSVGRLAGMVWYTLDGPGFYNSALLDAFGQPRPAYTTYQFMASLLIGATFDRTITIDSGEGYSFVRGDTAYEIYWMNSNATEQLAPPIGLRAIYNLKGERSVPTGSRIQVTFEPMIFEVQR